MKWTTERLLFFTLLLSAFTPKLHFAENETVGNCDVELYLDPIDGETHNISSPGYPDKSYSPEAAYKWCLSAPDDRIISITCDEFDIPQSVDCDEDALTVSLGNENPPRSHCGTTSFRAKSSSSKMMVGLHSSKKSRGGKFLCQVKAEEKVTLVPRAIVYENCECGYSYRMRIVGGQETRINEFPFMAGLVDARRRGAIIVCGAAIISPRYVLTADHCLESLVVNQTGIVVGEHNISTGSETSATRVIKALRFIRYPYYNSNTRRYDLALIELASPITYSSRVGPVCLPFVSRDWDLTREYVTVLGWGTTEFGGPRSKVLMKVDLQIVDVKRCINTYGSDIDAYTQLCTFTEGADACQYDSGGPLVYFNPSTNRYEIVGLVSYGRGCATQAPGVNTMVAPFLQYILDNTKSETYCYRKN